MQKNYKHWLWYLQVTEDSVADIFSETRCRWEENFYRVDHPPTVVNNFCNMNADAFRYLNTGVLYLVFVIKKNTSSTDLIQLSVNYYTVGLHYLLANPDTVC